ncbi:MAG: SusC/RagA family TonB-linked outer membrane protein [Rikenellaceae bacterium]|nr:SusC/RagA family TonB-linked outer membrane protein [Rikenellaceae bacterium]
MKKTFLFIFLLLILVYNAANAQRGKISGTVRESGTNTPVPFTTIQLKGTTQGTTTLENGSYSIEAPLDGSLIFSFIGYKTVEIPIGKRLVIDVLLEPDATNLEEVVMIAYGTAKKESVTGSITTINNRSIQKRALSSVASVLEGQASGIQVNNTYGEPGTDPEIRIRGFTSVNGSNEPLYVIDGVPFNGKIADLNPADIANISILKDAASSALYGNRASNGVVMITTKKGSSERSSLRAVVNQGVFSRGSKEYERMNADQYMEVMWKGFRNSLMTSQPALYPSTQLANAEATKSLIPTYLKYNIYNLPDDQLFDENGKLVQQAKVLPGYTDLDWFKPMERMGHRQDYVISGESASEKQSMFFSFGYLDEKGYVKSSDFSRLTGRANISFTPAKWIKTGIVLSGSHQVSNSTTGSAVDNATTIANPFYFARVIAPIYPIYLHDMETGEYETDQDGKRIYDAGDRYMRPQLVGRHVIWEYELNLDKTTRNTLGGQIYADVKFLKDFTLTLRGDLSLINSQRHIYQNTQIGDGMGTGRANKTIRDYKTHTMQQILTWNKEVGLHGFDAMIAHENFSYNYIYNFGFKTGQIFQGDNKELINFSVISNLYSYQRDYRTESYLSRVRYNYDNKYFFDASLRRDGTSKFHPDNRWGNFWSAGASWVISKEDFMSPMSGTINSLKLRASYGEVGNDGGTDNDAINFHAYLPLYFMTQNGNRGAIYKSQNEAADLMWESASSFGIGLDGRYFDRINLSVEYFDKRSKDLLFDVYLPLSAGATSSDAAEATIKKNIGSVANRGFELTLDADVVRKGNFSWNIGIMATTFKNKILRLPDQNREKGIVDGTKKYMEGHDRYKFWMYQFAGVDQMTGKSLYIPDTDRYYIGEAEEGKTQFPAQWLENINGVPYTTNFSYAARGWSGSAIPDIYGSLSTSVSWGNFEFSALCTYSLGGKVLDEVYMAYMTVNSTPDAQHKDLLKSWDGIPAGMEADSPDRIDPNGIPVIDYSLSENNNARSSRFVLDGSYFVVKNLSMGYIIPKKWSSKMGVNNISLSASVENLATFTKLRGMDPQQSFTGINNNGFVTASVVSLGLNINL